MGVEVWCSSLFISEPPRVRVMKPLYNKQLLLPSDPPKKSWQQVPAPSYAFSFSERLEKKCAFNRVWGSLRRQKKPPVVIFYNAEFKWYNYWHSERRSVSQRNIHYKDCVGMTGANRGLCVLCHFREKTKEKRKKAKNEGEGTDYNQRIKETRDLCHHSSRTEKTWDTLAEWKKQIEDCMHLGRLSMI